MRHTSRSVPDGVSEILLIGHIFDPNLFDALGVRHLRISQKDLGVRNSFYESEELDVESSGLSRAMARFSLGKYAPEGSRALDP